MYLAIASVAAVVLFAWFKLRLAPPPRGGLYGVGRKLASSHQGQTAPVPFDSSSLVQLAKSQIPDRPEITRALEDAKTILGFCPCGCGQPYFVDSRSPRWHKIEDIVLHDGGKSIILHVVDGGKIGSIEEF